MKRKRNHDDDPSVEVPYWRCVRTHLSAAHSHLDAAIRALDPAVIDRSDAMRADLVRLDAQVSRVRGLLIRWLAGQDADLDSDDEIEIGEDWPQPDDYR